MFNVKLTIGRKLILLVALQVAAIFLILGVSAYQMRETLMEERRLALHNVVGVADSIVRRYAQFAEQGAMSEEQAQREALTAVGALRYADGNYLWVNDLQLDMLSHPNPKLQGTNVASYQDANGKRFFPELVDAVKRAGEGYVEYQWRRTETTAPALKISYGRATAWDWVVATGIYADDVATTANAKTWRLAWLFLGIAVGLIIVSAIVARTITRPLKATVASLHELAEGDGDLSRQLPEDSSDELGDLGRAFNVFAGKLRALVAEARGVASRVSGAAGELSTVAEQVTRAAQAQAAGLEETAASLEEITATVKQNSDSAQQANQLAAGSHQAAVRGGQVVSEAVAAMAEINTSSRKIADIIATIDEIAFQTNLLALNASVEAARAGEQGRGFAVVASEVQTLAKRSATAAREIKALIQDSVAKVDAGTLLVNRSGETLHEIVSSVKRVTDIIAEIAAASHEQSAGVDQVNNAVTSMDQSVQAAASQTETLSNTAHNLSSEAVQLEALVGRFQIDASESRTQRSSSSGQMGVTAGAPAAVHPPESEVGHTSRRRAAG